MNVKQVVRKIGSYKKEVLSFLEGKDKKEGKEESKEHTVVIDDPAQFLGDENQQEESSEEVITISGEEIPQALEFLHASMKKLIGANKQLSSVGKHLSTLQFSDQHSAIEKQLIAGYESLNVWSETIHATIKKHAPPYTPTSPPIKVWTIKKLLKICKHTAQAITVLLGAIKAVAAFKAGNAAVQKQVAMSTRTVRDAMYQLLCAWESFPAAVIPDLDVVNQIGVTSKQIISMCDNVEAAAGPAKSMAALSSNRLELIAACRAAAAATTRLIYAHIMGEKYKAITPATTTLKVILSTITQVLAVTATISAILFRQDEATPLKILLASASHKLKRAADKLDESGKDPSQIKPKVPPEILAEEPSRLSIRSVSAPVVSIAATILAKPPRAFTATPTMTSVPRSTPTSPQNHPLVSQELNDALLEIQALIEKQITSQPPEILVIRKISGSADEIPTVGANTPSPSASTTPTNQPASPLSLSGDTTAPELNGSSSTIPTPTTPTRSPPTNTELNTPNNSQTNTQTNTDTNTNTNTSVTSTPPTENIFANYTGPVVGLSRSGQNVPIPIPQPRISPRENSQSNTSSESSSSSSNPPTTPNSNTSNNPTTSPSHPTTNTNPTGETWTKYDPTSLRSPRASIRFPRADPINTSSPPTPNTYASPPVSPVASAAPSSPISPPQPRKPSRKISPDDMTLYKLFALIPPGNKEDKDQRTPHAGKKLLKVLVAVVAVYDKAIEIAQQEIREMATRTDLPRSPSAQNVATGDYTPVQISTQCLTDALIAIEAGIPQLPPAPPAVPTASPQNGRRSGDSEVDIWLEPPDEEGENIMYNETGKIRAGTLNKLVERLTSPALADLKFMKTFITTYRSFCSPETLLHKLMQRFDVPDTDSVNELPIRLRVCNVLRQWVENQFLDFDKQLLQTLVAFVDGKLIKHNSYKTFATSILNTIAAKQTESGMRVVTMDLRTESKGIQLTPSRLLFVFDEEEIAKQLTLIDFSIYSAIRLCANS